MPYFKFSNVSEELLAGQKSAREKRNAIVTTTDRHDIFILDAYKSQLITSSFFYELLKPFIKAGDSADDIINNRTIIIELSFQSTDEYSRAVRRLCTELFQRERFNIPLEKLSFAARLKRFFS
jgi:hypothetical protein